MSAAPAAPLLTPSIFAAFGAGLATLAEHAGTRLLATSAATAPDDGRSVTPTVLALSVPTFLADLELLGEECFGPVSLVVEYDGVDELRQAVDALPGSLVASVQLATEDADWVGALLEDLAARTGRLVVNGWPTGVAVTWAMQHGGPHPVTTNSLHTSVGATAPRRWLRPVAYQGVPEQHLPPALQTANPWRVPRRVNGVLDAGTGDRFVTGRGLRFSRLGFGAAVIGNLYRATSDEDARAAVDAAWAAGIRYFDTAPHYGLGLSERRLGAALADRPRDEYTCVDQGRPAARPRRPAARQGRRRASTCRATHAAGLGLQPRRRPALDREQPGAARRRPARPGLRARSRRPLAGGDREARSRRSSSCAIRASSAASGRA